MSPSPGCGSSLVPASGTDQQTGPSPGSLLGLRTQGSGPSESGTCWTRRSKSGSDSGPGIQGHKTWVVGISGRSGGTVKQRPAGSGMSKARLGAIGGGRSRHHCCCGPGRPHTLAVTEGLRRQLGGTKEAEAGRRSVTGRCAGRGSGSARAPSVSHRAAVPRQRAVQDVIGSKVMRYSVHPFSHSNYNHHGVY